MVITLVIALLLWAGMLATLATLNDSDPAGNAMSQAFGALFTIAVWALLGVLVILAGIKGQMPGWTIAAAGLLLPASCVAALAAGDLLKDTLDSPARWPILVPAVAPLLIAAFALWVYFPRIHQAVPAALAGSVVWGLVLALSIAPWPLVPMRTQAREARMAEYQRQQDENRARFAKLSPDAPLWEWLPFIRYGTTNEFQAEALSHIRHLKTRQSDAEVMMERGDFPLGSLYELELDPTASLCDKARRLLRKRAQELQPKVPNQEKYTVVAVEMDGAVSDMQWLVKNKCDCNAESVAFEAVANSYQEVNGRGWTLVELRKLREPQ
jgi:hypothetical protein